MRVDHPAADDPEGDGAGEFPAEGNEVGGDEVANVERRISAAMMGAPS